MNTTTRTSIGYTYQGTRYTLGGALAALYAANPDIAGAMDDAMDTGEHFVDLSDELSAVAARFFPAVDVDDASTVDPVKFPKPLRDEELGVGAELLDHDGTRVRVTCAACGTTNLDDGRGGLCGPCDKAEDACSQCGDPTDDGEGYDGLCGNCADRAEAPQD